MRPIGRRLRSLPLLMPVLLGGALACAGCSKTAQTKSGEAADAVAADVNATAAQAVDETSKALDAAGKKIDNAGDAAKSGAGNVADDVSTAADSAGRKIDNAM